MVYGFAVLKGLLIVPVGTMGFFWPGVNPYGRLQWRLRSMVLQSWAMGSFRPGFGPSRAVGELMGCVQGRKLFARARLACLAFRGLSCWWHSVELAVYGFAVLRGLLVVPVGTMNSFWPGVYPAGGLRWRLTCGFDFVVIGEGGGRGSSFWPVG